MTRSNSAKVLTGMLLLAVCMQMCSGSAIPIWEFLTRNEKMSYLYSTFAQLVSVHCKATATVPTAPAAVPVNQCKRNLLSYGNEKLQTFSDAQLDALDPYQRGANELIWSSIMRDHPSSTLITTRKSVPTPPSTSIYILTHQKPTSSAATPIAATTTQQYPANPLFADREAEHKPNYAMDMDVAYGYASLPVNAQVETFEQQQQQQPTQKNYLTGPLVFRVRTDGSPVEEDRNKPLPRDDDLETYQLSAGSTTARNAANVSGSTHKHRRIATISALKQQHLAALALQQQLQPPYEQPRRRRQYQVLNNARVQLTPVTGYYYGRGQL